MKIRIDDLRSPEIATLLEEHLQSMHQYSPPESVHALDLNALRKPEITFWTAWEGKELLGCGALKELDPTHGEIKSMRTSTKHLRKGVAMSIMQVILAEAKKRSYRRLSLETGSMAAFVPARTMYAQLGFEPCGPFVGYVEDRHSVFMKMDL
ncbi:MAG TPA: GNAT family N-acetyltransferase [Usitatibacteraceae bacterium]